MAFDAAQWLAEFEAVGGGWVITDRVQLVVYLDGQTDEDLGQARELIVRLSEDDRTALRAHLECLQAQEADHG